MLTEYCILPAYGNAYIYLCMFLVELGPITDLQYVNWFSVFVGRMFRILL